MAIKISQAAAIAACDAVVDRIDVGASTSNLIIYGGTRPADAATATAETPLVTFALPDPCFGNSVYNAANGARATAEAITPVNVANSGTATWFRVVNGDGNAVMDGSCSLSAGTGDCKLSDVDLVAGIQVQVFSWTTTMPMG